MTPEQKIFIRGQANALATIFMYNDVAFKDMCNQCSLILKDLKEAEVDEYDFNIIEKKLAVDGEIFKYIRKDIYDHDGPDGRRVTNAQHVDLRDKYIVAQARIKELEDALKTKKRYEICPKCSSPKICYWIVHDKYGCYDCDWREKETT